MASALRFDASAPLWVEKLVRAAKLPAGRRELHWRMVVRSMVEVPTRELTIHPNGAA